MAGKFETLYNSNKFVPDFRTWEEGKLYLMKNFTMQETKPTYKVVNEKLMIVVDGSTYIKEVIEDLPSIPRHKFSLIAYDEIQK